MFSVGYVAMPRRARRSAGGVVYHALNRANARAAIFLTGGDYLAFEAVPVEAKGKSGRGRSFWPCRA